MPGTVVREAQYWVLATRSYRGLDPKAGIDRCTPTALRACYAKSGTDIAYAGRSAWCKGGRESQVAAP
eukprot:1340689-Rhodomonas_salina.2